VNPANGVAGEIILLVWPSKLGLGIHPRVAFRRVRG